ncbi:hypothetical protein [Pseudobacteroides cellulosolvens]|uniref:Uncharacterized protein n=1 Tax=Pseudobacteroides cellulosolvens ATCC 35603 = DSM 2933 TaxID=398512 RepID=A0A0L6JIG3_9FIRM|nr:hypothetical protein [Pseudobacteroides cellulosolvens]KNY25529.1 hypothetical protein Bccel_0789 [Pseudobacteroides cellulosolvens ATCC 35603 = DSM 2933]
MGYYVRAFCTSDRVPTIKEIFDWAASQGYKLGVSDNFKDIDMKSNNWERVDILYKAGKLPILSEINRDEGTDNCLMREEIEEFKERLSEVRGLLNIKKKKVETHLANTRYIVANELPISNIDDDGYNANYIFLKYFVVHCGGMIQANGEGFYEGDKLIIKID